MSMELVDVHSHLGDILYENGGGLIQKKGVKDRNLFDGTFKPSHLIDAGFYAGLLKYRHHGDEPNQLLRAWGTFSNRLRNFVATLENMGLSLDAVQKKHGFDGVKSCCLPVPPNVTFEDLRGTGDPRVIPFTGVDFSTNLEDLPTTLQRQVREGARGMKIHPIIQQISLTHEKVRNAVEEFGPYDLPILFHSGVTTYYFGDEESSKQKPENGNIDDAKKLASDFPEVPFIVGHAGGIQVNEVIEKLSGFENVFVDTSFQSPEVIIELIRTFGVDRVLYASDWPYGDRTKSVEMVIAACRDDIGKLEKVLGGNASKLLKLR